MRIITNSWTFRTLFVGLLIIFFSVDIIASRSKSGVCGDNVIWSLIDGTLRFHGSGPMPDYGGYRPWHEKSVKRVIIDEGITNIGKRTFKDCYNLQKVSIPSSVESIGDSAFYECRSLTDIVIPNSVCYVGSNCFYGCNELAVLIVPDNPFDVGIDTTLNLSSCYKLSIVRGHHSLCPDYMLKYIPKLCPFVREGNPRRYYGGSITRNGEILVPPIRTYTLQEAKDTLDMIFNTNFSLSSPCTTYQLTKNKFAEFVTILEIPMYEDLLQHYHDEFYEAGRNNELDNAAVCAFKHVMLGGTTDAELMWNIIITKYGAEAQTDNTRFLMSQFSALSARQDSAYKHTIDSLTSVYYDVLYPLTLREMCGYWVSVADTTEDGELTDAPNYIINIADITCPNGTTILSSPKCEWSTKKKKGQWENRTYDNSQLRYSYDTRYTHETQTLHLLFSSQSKKIANTKLQHHALDMVQDFESYMKASVDQFQKELNRGYTNNWIGTGSYIGNTTIATGIGIGVSIVAAVAVFAIMYSSNIETAYAYEIQMTPQAPNILDVSVRYATARHNYNNGETKQTEEISRMTFVKWEASDSIVFISDSRKPIFMGETLAVDNSLLDEYNGDRSRANCEEINRTSIGKLRNKAEKVLQAKERNMSRQMESSDKENYSR